MRKPVNRKIMYYALCLLVILIGTLSLAYAALSVTLNISGNAQVNATSWNVYLTNPVVTEGSVSSTLPSITSSVSAAFSVNLSKPGDFYEFTIDVVNDGEISALIDSITKNPTLTDAQAKYLNYIITYNDSSDINVEHVLKQGETAKIKVRIEFRRDLEAGDLPSTTETLNLSIGVNYVQTEDEPSGPEPVEVVVISGDGTKTGDEIAIGDEHFYVINNDGDEISMLAKYNLRVGIKYESKFEAMADAHGRQDSESRGYVSATDNKSVVAFTDTVYWTNGEHGDYVYSDQASISTYVNNYKNYLIGLGVTINEARLVTYDELTNKLGCSTVTSECSSSMSWVYYTSYWSGTLVDNERLWTVNTNNVFYYDSYDWGMQYGVRPVIVIPSNLI